MDIHELARQNQQSAWKVLEDTCNPLAELKR